VEIKRHHYPAVKSFDFRHRKVKPLFFVGAVRRCRRLHILSPFLPC
jgi:hypothetical protein